MTETVPAAPPAPLLQLRGLTKSFPGVQALAGVDFTVRRGEIHALMGENGAGKSTLIKVLTGVHRRDGGEAFLEGRSIDPHSPKQAQELGISTVYQEVNLIPFLSVAENICLGRQPHRCGAIAWGVIRQRAERALARLGITLDVNQTLADCSIAVQQLVAVARALDISAQLLILDEPTSSLDEQEVERLFGVMRRLKAEGLGIVFVTHFLDQVYAVSDRITVLRNGRFVGEYEAAGLPRLELIARMMGKTVSELDWRAPAPAGDTPRAQPLLQLRGLGRKGSVQSLDLSVAPGEVVGLAGLLGSGRTETARLIFGVDTPDAGRMEVLGVEVSVRSPRHAIGLGFGFCPEDRKVAGILPNLSVRENIVVALQASQGWTRHVSGAQQDELADKFITALQIKTPHREQPVRLLSGGNQQKVILARWLASQPKLLLLDEPTRGIDVGAKAEIEKLMAQLTGQGLAILFISSDLEELVRNSARVVVLRDRRKVSELQGAAIS
ncbi:MAG TPA: sugar ABC transporter ATP-binding protein, partial [Candidatus Saccharimonadales bacterium]|nr:sugar ABC transporter ATP-binding protein [Candidatus Saccharimonadales bacterium]